MEHKTQVHYENNPFYIGLRGIQLIFKNAQQVGIYAAILAGIIILLNTVSTAVDTINSINEPIETEPVAQSITPTDIDTGEILAAIGAVAGIVVLISIVILAICLLLFGVLEYTAAQLALGKKVTLKEAFQAILKKFPGYLWLYILMTIKLFLWTLLLIIPGIIMSVRYSLASTVYFAEDKKGNAAIKRSLALTKGAWFTTFAGYNLWDIITFGQIAVLTRPAASTILYRQLKDVTDRGDTKPKTHWLSWLTFFIPIALTVLFIGFIVFMALVLWVAFS